MTAVTPFEFGGGAVLLLLAALVVAAWYVGRRPVTDTDRRCAAIDAELDANVSRFPARLRVVKGGLDEFGEGADGVWADVPTVPADGGPGGEFFPDPERAA